jgi:hypothetical protein
MEVIFMRKILPRIFVIFALAFIWGTALNANPHQQYQRFFDITIRVDDVEAAIQTIRAMDGHNLYSDMRLGEQGDSWASFQRRVDVTAHAAIMDVLRNMGHVLREGEHAIYLGQEIRDIEAGLVGNAREIERLLNLMATAQNLNVLVSVDNQLAWAERNRDQLRGRLNYLQNTAFHPYVNITLTESWLEIERDDEVLTFGQRLANAFKASVNGILTFLGHVAVFFAAAFIPLIILAILAFIILLVLRRMFRKQPQPASQPVVAPIIADDEPDTKKEV